MGRSQSNLSHSFDELTTNTQRLRLGRLAKSVINEYLIGSVRIEHLYHGMNNVFKVIHAETGNIFILRVHPNKWLPTAQVDAEMHWLHALFVEAGLPVPLPVKRQDGSSFTTIAGGSEVGGSRCCSLFHWTEGRLLSGRLTMQQMRQAGELLARIHEHGRHYTATSSNLFHRPRLDCEGIFGSGGIFDPCERITKLSEDEMAVITPSLQRVREAMDSLGSCPQSFGPIHGDFYFRNLLAFHGSIRVIDFDMSGWGYYCFDLAIPHWPGAIWKRGRNYLAAILDGYRTVREFPEEQEKHLSAMLAARRLMDIYCCLSRWDDPIMMVAFKDSVQWACSRLNKWLNTDEIS